MFITHQLSFSANPFENLNKASPLENISRGREGGIIVQPNKKGDLPLVRSTTSYQKPPGRMEKVHHQVIDKIYEIAKIKNLYFNNAMVEVYDNQYTKMGWHTDLSLDLSEDTYIGLFSCYQNPDLIKGNNHCRKLVVKNKETGKIESLPMNHLSVILFSYSTNQQHLHKIILHNVRKDNSWLGITFRLSKSWVRHKGVMPTLLPINQRLTLASQEQRIEFYELRGAENKDEEYTYPEITYTLSPSDLMKCVSISKDKIII